MLSMSYYIVRWISTTTSVCIAGWITMETVVTYFEMFGALGIARAIQKDW